MRRTKTVCVSHMFEEVHAKWLVKKTSGLSPPNYWLNAIGLILLHFYGRSVRNTFVGVYYFIIIPFRVSLVVKKPILMKLIFIC